MIALVLSINGQKICTVGVGDSGVRPTPELVFDRRSVGGYACGYGPPRE